MYNMILFAISSVLVYKRIFDLVFVWKENQELVESFVLLQREKVCLNFTCDYIRTYLNM